MMFNLHGVIKIGTKSLLTRNSMNSGPIHVDGKKLEKILGDENYSIGKKQHVIHIAILIKLDPLIAARAFLFANVPDFLHHNHSCPRLMVQLLTGSLML